MPVRPIVVISRCIDFDSCRYNGQVIRTSLREELEPFVELRPICPELEIGLGVPRDPVRLIRHADGARMVQPSTGRDLTEAMGSFATGFLDSVAEVDGFILKSRSPSCAVRNSKVFHSDAEDAGHDSGPGLFAAQVLARFPDAAIEDEGRLNDERLRGHFLTKLFTLASFRVAAAQGDRRALVEFHAAQQAAADGLRRGTAAPPRAAGGRRAAPAAGRAGVHVPSRACRRARRATAPGRGRKRADARARPPVRPPEAAPSAATSSRCWTTTARAGCPSARRSGCSARGPRGSRSHISRARPS